MDEATMYSVNGQSTSRRYTVQHWGRRGWVNDLNTSSNNQACDRADELYDKHGYRRVRVLDNAEGTVAAGYGVKNANGVKTGRK